EAAADPIAVVERYVRGEAAPKLPAEDEWRWLWGKVLEDCRGDPQLLAKKIWLWREPLKRKAPPAYRGLVDYVCKLAESNPQSALDLVRALADGRKVEVRAVEERFDRVAFFRELGERLAAFDDVAKAVYARAGEVGLERALMERSVLRRLLHLRPEGAPHR
ncbi:hypothetical protein, partial [Pyrobaculum sp.]|uniref:hypothetical protein n=1 Tax=Pyrobaculum sp. TaxID=2004705 RepID=UPI003D147372